MGPFVGFWIIIRFLFFSTNCELKNLKNITLSSRNVFKESGLRGEFFPTGAYDQLS